MIAVDTNVVLRLILGDDEAQLALIRDLMTRDSLFVSLTILLEAGWVLESRYRLPRTAVADALADLVALEGIAVPRVAIVTWALQRYREGADLADMLHIASAAKLEEFATLDQRLARQAGPDAPIAIQTLR